MYPTVQANMNFPKRAHPDLIEGGSLPFYGERYSLQQVQEYFGIFSVCIMYVETPFYPPVAYKVRDKCVFGCCRAVSPTSLQKSIN